MNTSKEEDQWKALGLMLLKYGLSPEDLLARQVLLGSKEPNRVLRFVVKGQTAQEIDQAVEEEIKQFFGGTPPRVNVALDVVAEKVLTLGTVEWIASVTATQLGEQE